MLGLDWFMAVVWARIPIRIPHIPWKRTYLSKSCCLLRWSIHFEKVPFFSWHSLMFPGVEPVKHRWNSIIPTRSRPLHPEAWWRPTAAAAEVLQLLPEMQWQQEHLGPTARYPPQNQQLAAARRAPKELIWTNYWFSGANLRLVLGRVFCGAAQSKDTKTQTNTKNDPVL